MTRDFWTEISLRGVNVKVFSVEYSFQEGEMIWSFFDPELSVLSYYFASI